MSTAQLQIVVPMAGLGSRFAEAGYVLPKPLIDVAGHPMIELVIANLTPARSHRFIFVVQAAQVREHGLDARLRTWSPGCEIVAIEGVTEGAACTVLTTRDLLAPTQPLMIANCDQFIDASIDAYLEAFDVSGADGAMMTMWADDAKWSFAELGPDGWVTRVVEKQVVSDIATVGIYNFRRAADFLAGADTMIASQRRVNGEFYVAPVFNELIARGARVFVHPIDTDGSAMHGLGTPTDLETFLRSAVLPRAMQEVT